MTKKILHKLVTDMYHACRETEKAQVHSFTDNLVLYVHPVRYHSSCVYQLKKDGVEIAYLGKAKEMVDCLYSHAV